MGASEPHGKEGHLNACRLDHDSIITGRGKHDRVVAFLPDGEGAYCRVDHLWGLGMPSQEEIIKVMRDQGIRGKWVISSMEEHSDGHATDVHLVDPAKVVREQKPAEEAEEEGISM